MCLVWLILVAVLVVHLVFTSSKWSPYDPSDGLHPVVHVTLGVGHEQKRLMAHRSLVFLTS